MWLRVKRRLSELMSSFPQDFQKFKITQQPFITAFDLHAWIYVDSAIEDERTRVGQSLARI